MMLILYKRQVYSDQRDSAIKVPQYIIHELFL